MISAFVAAMLGVVVAQVSPGPNMMAVAGAALKQGRGRALLVVTGIASGTIVWCVSTVFGLGTLFRLFPQLLTVLAFVGAAYLFWIAARSLRAAWTDTGRAIGANADNLTAWGAWRRGLLVVMLNPKSALMWSALATILYGAGVPMLGVLALGPMVATTALLIYGGYGLLFSSRLIGRVYARFSRAVEFAFGATFGALGCLLLAMGVRALRP